MLSSTYALLKPSQSSAVYGTMFRQALSFIGSCGREFKDIFNGRLTLPHLSPRLGSFLVAASGL